MKPDRKKNNHESGLAGDNRNTSGKDDAYADENMNVTDSDAAEIDPRIKNTSQASGNTIEEGDEDYDDEEENT
jgi:hypothetical protein